MGRPSKYKVGDVHNGMKIINIEGKGVGKHTKITFECHCGNIKDMKTHIFTKSKSCGCQKHDISTWKSIGPKSKPWTLPKGEAAFNNYLYAYKRAARKRNLEFDLSKEEFKEIVTQNCFYCGIEPQERKPQKSYNGSMKMHGVDRKDNEIGYTIKNSVSCCSTCNFMKLKMTIDDFVNHIKRIYENQRDKKQCSI